jgi:hypothetical protein
MDKLLFGDNQFFGINHIRRKGAGSIHALSDVQAIIDTWTSHITRIRTFCAQPMIA